MSVSNLLSDNNLSLFSNQFNTRKLFAAQVLSKLTMSLWDPTVTYDTSSFAIYGGVIYR